LSCKRKRIATLRKEGSRLRWLVSSKDFARFRIYDVNAGAREAFDRFKIVTISRVVGNPARNVLAREWALEQDRSHCSRIKRMTSSQVALDQALNWSPAGLWTQPA
jgi:hypothetical protein